MVKHWQCSCLFPHWPIFAPLGWRRNYQLVDNLDSLGIFDHFPVCLDVNDIRWGLLLFILEHVAEDGGLSWPCQGLVGKWRILRVSLVSKIKVWSKGVFCSVADWRASILAVIMAGQGGSCRGPFVNAKQKSLAKLKFANLLLMEELG